MTDTAPETRGGFPQIRPVEEAPAELGRFVAAVRRLQDLTVSTNPDSSTWATAARPVVLRADAKSHSVSRTGAMLCLPGREENCG
jgi:hypothetical protein